MLASRYFKRVGAALLRTPCLGATSRKLWTWTSRWVHAMWFICNIPSKSLSFLCTFVLMYLVQFASAIVFVMVIIKASIEYCSNFIQGELWMQRRAFSLVLWELDYETWSWIRIRKFRWSCLFNCKVSCSIFGWSWTYRHIQFECAIWTSWNFRFKWDRIVCVKRFQWKS